MWSSIKIITNQPPSVMVMEFDQRLDIASLPIPAIHKLSRFLEAKAHVVAAAPPLPPIGRHRGGGKNWLPSTAGLWYTLKKNAYNNKNNNALTHRDTATH